MNPLGSGDGNSLVAARGPLVDPVMGPVPRDSDGRMHLAVESILRELGEDPARPGLLETPARVTKAWRHWTQGLHQDPKTLFKTFDDIPANEMVLVKGVEFYSHCEHHMAPFFGVAHVAYIPNGNKVVGLSKLARVVDIFSQRLQVQERLTTQIADCITENLDPLGVGVVMKAKHFCMCSRGVNKQGSETVTSALRGWLEKGWQRQEFLTLINT